MACVLEEGAIKIAARFDAGLINEMQNPLRVSSTLFSLKAVMNFQQINGMNGAITRVSAQQLPDNQCARLQPDQSDDCSRIEDNHALEDGLETEAACVAAAVRFTGARK